MPSPTAAAAVGQSLGSPGKPIGTKSASGTPESLEGMKIKDPGGKEGDVLTGDDGRYAFDDLLPGDHFVLAEVPGYLDAEGKCELEPGQRLT